MKAQTASSERERFTLRLHVANVDQLQLRERETYCVCILKGGCSVTALSPFSLVEVRSESSFALKTNTTVPVTTSSSDDREDKESTTFSHKQERQRKSDRGSN